MKQNISQEETELVLLPAWSKKRRIKTMLIMTGFILVASGLIGLGLHQIGVEKGWIQPSFSKKELTKNLLNDAGFIRAVNKSVSLRPCLNETKGFGFNYQAPFVLATSDELDKCTKLVTLHPTGADVLVTVESLDEAREVVVEEEVNKFEVVDASILDGTLNPTSKLSGIRQGIETEVYVIGLSREKSYKITYAPTSATLNSQVREIVDSFYIN